VRLQASLLLGSGANVFRWTITSGPCTASFDEVTITRSAAPTAANAGTDQTSACGATSATLAGNTPVTGTGTWSVVTGAGGSFANPSSPTSTFTGVSGTTYTLRWTISNPPCASTQDDVIITLRGLPTITITPPSASFCNGDSVLLTASGANTYSWSPATDLSITTGFYCQGLPQCNNNIHCNGYRCKWLYQYSQCNHHR
jgi:hypothetical protein